VRAKTEEWRYSAAKFAVAAFSESLRQEVSAQKIRVTVIEPGIVAAKLTQKIGGKVFGSSARS
jgi:NADP-dependent 3-hydroxy acid dehydrogenase YdfG